jgi:hypothetical protein
VPLIENGQYVSNRLDPHRTQVSRRWTKPARKHGECKERPQKNEEIVGEDRHLTLRGIIASLLAHNFEWSTNIPGYRMDLESDRKIVYRFYPPI